MENIPVQTARLATLASLKKTTLPAFLDPVPSNDTLRDWFKHVPQFKANPTARKGGGTVYYSVSGVEKLLRAKLMPGKVSNN